MEKACVKKWVKLLVFCSLLMGAVFVLLPHEVVRLSPAQFVKKQIPLIVLPEQVYMNKTLITTDNSVNYSLNILSYFPYGLPYHNWSIVKMTHAEVRHVGFLKVYKAGSTTLQNMFFRFGLKRNLTFVINNVGNHYGVSKWLPVKKGGHYDILAIHTSGFDKSQFDKLLPSDKVNIGIVREPLDRMISAAYYYRDVWNFGHLRSIPKDNFIQELVSHPEKYDRGAFSATKNSMGKDFGFAPTTREFDTDKIVKKLKFLETEFRLVLVMDRFEESLILLKRYLLWHVSDILFIPSNAHKHVKPLLTEEQKLKHKHTCFLDYAIYDFFTTIFDYKVKAEGPEFQDEVRNFRDILKELKTFCTHAQGGNTTLIVKSSKWNSEFGVSRYDCELMLLSEPQFIKWLRTRHIQMNNLAPKVLSKTSNTTKVTQ